MAHGVPALDPRLCAQSESLLFLNHFSSHQSLFSSQKILVSWSWVLFPLPGMSPPTASVGYILLIFNLKANQVSSLPSSATAFSFSPSHSPCLALPFLLQLPGEQQLTSMSLCAGLWETSILEEETRERDLGTNRLTGGRGAGQHAALLHSVGAVLALLQLSDGRGSPHSQHSWCAGPWEEMRCQERAHSSTTNGCGGQQLARQGTLTGLGFYLNRWIVWLTVWSFSFTLAVRYIGSEKEAKVVHGQMGWLFPGQRTERLHE